MKTPAHYSQVPQTEKPMETFPKPNTIPNGWDISDLVNDSNSDANANETLQNCAGSIKVTESVACSSH